MHDVAKDVCVGARSGDHSNRRYGFRDLVDWNRASVRELFHELLDGCHQLVVVSQLLAPFHPVLGGVERCARLQSDLGLRCLLTVGAHDHSIDKVSSHHLDGLRRGRRRRLRPRSVRPPP